MPRSRNCSKTSLQRKGKDIFFRVNYKEDLKNGAMLPKAKALMIKEVMAIIERYNLDILSVQREHPFMEKSPPSSPPTENIFDEIPEEPPRVSTTSTTIDLVTPPVSEDEGEEDDLGYAPKKKVQISCPEELDEDTGPIDAIVFDVGNLFAMQARCKLQIETLQQDIKKHEEEIKELRNLWNLTIVKNTIKELKEKALQEIHEVDDINEADVPPTSPPTPPDTQEID